MRRVQCVDARVRCSLASLVVSCGEDLNVYCEFQQRISDLLGRAMQSSHIPGRLRNPHAILYVYPNKPSLQELDHSPMCLILIAIFRMPRRAFPEQVIFTIAKAKQSTNLPVPTTASLSEPTPTARATNGLHTSATQPCSQPSEQCSLAA